jgi:hypothetical protein
MQRLNPYSLGAMGMEQVAGNSVPYSVAANGASAGSVDIVVLPAGCVITRTLVQVTEAFNASSNVLTVGTNDDINNLMGAGDVNEEAVGFNIAATPVYLRTAAKTTVKAKYVQAGTPTASAGNADVFVFFARVE